MDPLKRTPQEQYASEEWAGWTLFDYPVTLVDAKEWVANAANAPVWTVAPGETDIFWLAPGDDYPPY